MIQKNQKSENHAEPLKNEAVYKNGTEIRVVKKIQSIPSRTRRPMLKRQNAIEIPE